jgi:hypothetical protein
MMSGRWACRCNDGFSAHGPQARRPGPVLSQPINLGSWRDAHHCGTLQQSCRPSTRLGRHPEERCCPHRRSSLLAVSGSAPSFTMPTDRLSAIAASQVLARPSEFARIFSRPLTRSAFFCWPAPVAVRRPRARSERTTEIRKECSPLASTR